MNLRSNYGPSLRRTTSINMLERAKERPNVAPDQLAQALVFWHRTSSNVVHAVGMCVTTVRVLLPLDTYARKCRKLKKNSLPGTKS